MNDTGANSRPSPTASQCGRIPVEFSVHLPDLSDLEFAEALFSRPAEKGSPLHEWNESEKGRSKQATVPTVSEGAKPGERPEFGGVYVAGAVKPPNSAPATRSRPCLSAGKRTVATDEAQRLCFPKRLIFVSLQGGGCHEAGP